MAMPATGIPVTSHSFSQMAFFLDELVHEKSGIVEILLLEAFTVGVEVGHADADKNSGEALCAR